MLSNLDLTGRNTVYNYRPKIASIAPARKMSEKAASILPESVIENWKRKSAENSNPVGDGALTDSFWVDKVARWAFPLAYFIFGGLNIGFILLNFGQKFSTNKVAIYLYCCLSFESVGYYDDVKIYKHTQT